MFLYVFLRSSEATFTAPPLSDLMYPENKK